MCLIGMFARGAEDAGKKPPARGDWITDARVEGLASAPRAAWLDYLERSRAAAVLDQRAVADELRSLGLEVPARAPSGGDFKMSRDPDDPWFATPEAGALADIILSYQTPAGGWSKHTGYGKGPRQPGMLWSSQYAPGGKPHYLGTFDNRSTTAQLKFLAAVWKATGREDCAAAFLSGLDYVLAAQYPNGGWPQVYPLEGDYHNAITLNDDAMTNVLILLDAALSDDGFRALVDDARRAAATEALERGIDCAMQMQVRRNGIPAGWCAQYNPLTLEPVGARQMEPAAFGSVESSNLLKFLMRQENPDDELTGCINGGLAWLERVAITGLTKTKVDGKTVYVADLESQKVYWARFYHLADDRPIFPGRDGVIYDSYAEMAANNPLGYDYYSTRPGSVMRTQQKKWRKKLRKK